MSKNTFQLTNVQPLPTYRPRLDYANRQTFEVNLHPWLHGSKALKQLKDPSIFAYATLSLGGCSVEWIKDELDLGADNLHNLTIEQDGGIGHECIWNSLHDNELSLSEAAKPWKFRAAYQFTIAMPQNPSYALSGLLAWDGKPFAPRESRYLGTLHRFLNAPNCISNINQLEVIARFP